MVNEVKNETISSMHGHSDDASCAFSAPHQSSVDVEALAAARSDSVVMDGQKWAFVHRMVEEVKDAAGASTRQLGASDRQVAQPLSKSELHSIAVFCEQSKCPLPKVVSGCLLEEGTQATLAGALLLFAVHVTMLLGGVLFAILGLESLGVISDEEFGPLAWFVRGYSMSLGLVGWIALVMLFFALFGRSKIALCGSLMWSTFCAAFCFILFIMSAAEVHPMIRACFTFTALGVFLIVILAMMFALLVG